VALDYKTIFLPREYNHLISFQGSILSMIVVSTSKVVVLLRCVQHGPSIIVKMPISTGRYGTSGISCFSNMKRSTVVWRFLFISFFVANKRAMLLNFSRVSFQRHFGRYI
jgi:hypothetical protein